MRKRLLIITSIFICLNGFASKVKYDFNINLIPDSLKKNANAVIRFHNIGFNFQTPVFATEKRSHAVTVLNNNGIEFANFYESGNKFKKIKSFSGSIYNSNGEIIKKFKKNDIKVSAYSQHLATDNFIYYLPCNPPSIPFTVHYEYEVEWKNGIIVFPVFSPQVSHHVSVAEANYTLQYPEETEIHTKSINQVKELPEEKIKGNLIRKWTVSNLRAISEERYAPAINTLIPIVFAAPRSFIYEKTQGELTNAEHICKWQNELNKGRNELSQETKKYISELVKDAVNDKEKVKMLYDYLGSITRYESIQLGIGGFQPIPANEVCRTGFGDCKGLSNLMKTMLNDVNIQANYVIIRMSRHEKDLDDDFTAFFRTNHIVLQVPLTGDTLWLECTNTKVPFGFIHNQIAGHNAIVTTEDGGYMTRLPDYPDSLNVEHNQMQIKLNTDGSAHVQVEKKWHVKIYDNVSHLVSAKSSDVTDYLRKEISLPNASVSQVKLEDNKSSLPSLAASYEWTTPLYGSKTANRLLIPANPARYTIAALKKGQRENNIRIITGWKDTDQLSIDIPEEYEVESLPGLISYECEFGNFSCTSLNIENQIYINQSVLVRSGQYDVSLYPEFVEFIEKISAMYKNRIILRKKSTS